MSISFSRDVRLETGAEMKRAACVRGSGTKLEILPKKRKAAGNRGFSIV